MIIDFHAHIFPDNIAKVAIPKLSKLWYFSPLSDGTLSGTKEVMKKWNTDKFVGLNVAQTESQEEKVNGFMLSVKDDACIPFMALHPFSKNFKEEIKKGLDNGLKGVKLHPEYQGFDIDDKKAYPLYEEITKNNLVMLFHAGYDVAYEESNRGYPDKAKNFIKDFKGAKIVLAHMGNYVDINKCEVLLGEKVYFDISLAYLKIQREDTEKFIKAHGVDKFLYATDCPWSNGIETQNYVNSLNLTKDEKEQIFYKNALKILEN